MSFVSESETILIVDDNPVNLEFLSEALMIDGFVVSVALDGESALEQSEYVQPNLILLDVMMPGIDGFETCKRLKENPLTKDIPVLFMTAISDIESKIKGLSLGAVDYITKPFEQSEVLARIKIHLKLRNYAKTLAEKNQLLQQEISRRNQAENALLELNQELEKRVESRTIELQTALKNLQQAQIKLIQQEKLSALGQLVAGIAHEINNPVGFISGNIKPAREYVIEIGNILKLYQKYYPEPAPEIKTQIKAFDIEFVLEDLSKILESMQLGSSRIENISLSLRNFSRSDTETKVLANLHDGLDSTLLLLKHRLKAYGDRQEIQTVKHYGNIPCVKCYPGQLNQVFMNLLANAIDAIEESKKGDTTKYTGLIQITTEIIDANWVAIRIADNGIGMKNEVQQRLFEPLFTTKPVGKGTGLGLSICHHIVVEKHGGELDCTSIPGQGTEFSIKIPVS